MNKLKNNYQRHEKLLLSSMTLATLGLLTINANEVKADEQVVPQEIADQTPKNVQADDQAVQSGEENTDTSADDSNSVQAVTPSSAPATSALQSSNPTLSGRAVTDDQNAATTQASQPQTNVAPKTKKIIEEQHEWEGSNGTSVKAIVSYAEDDVTGEISDIKLTILGGEISDPEPLGLEEAEEVNFADKLKISGDASNMFTSMYYMKRVTGLENVDTSEVTNMDMMFSYCYSLEKLDVSSFNTSSLKSAEGMFQGCHNMTDLNVSGFENDQLENMNGMFNTCEKLVNLNLTGFKTPKVTNMRWAFEGDESLVNLDLSGFSTENVKNMSGMFYGCTNLQYLNLSSFTLDFDENANTPQTDISDIFLDLDNLEVLVLGPKTKITADVDDYLTGIPGSDGYEDDNYIWLKVKSADPNFYPDIRQAMTPNEMLNNYDGTKDAGTYVRHAVVVGYQDENGNRIAPNLEKVLKGKLDAPYDASKEAGAQPIPGYTFMRVDETNGKEKGNYTEKPQEVVYVYTKNSANDHNPGNGSNPGTNNPGNGSNPGTNNPGNGSNPGTSNPGTSNPGNGSNPGTSNPGTNNPGNGSNPGTTNPGTNNPGNGSNPGTTNPGNNIPVPSEDNSAADEGDGPNAIGEIVSGVAVNPSANTSQHGSASKNKHKGNAVNTQHVSASANSKTASNNVNGDPAGQSAPARTLPQTGQDKHANLALLALGGLVLVGALGGAYLTRKKRS